MDTYHDNYAADTYDETADNTMEEGEYAEEIAAEHSTADTTVATAPLHEQKDVTYRKENLLLLVSYNAVLHAVACIGCNHCALANMAFPVLTVRSVFLLLLRDAVCTGYRCVG